MMKVETLIPAGRYFVCDVDSYPEFRDKVVVSYKVPAGVYYSTSGPDLEVFVGESDSAEFGNIGLIPIEFIRDGVYTEYELSDECYGFTLESDSVSYIDENGFGFGPMIFDDCLGLDE